MNHRTNDILHAALDYAQRGIPVFPCQVSNKAPLTRNGFKDASVGIEQIKCWWANHPDAIIGMPTGAASHLIVMDIDPRHGGDYSLQGLTGEHGSLPDTLTAITGGGGTHYYFKYPGRLIRCSTSKIAAGVDIKGDGGYVIVPPSGHESGNHYYWDGNFDLDVVADIPQWLLELMISEDKSVAKNNHPDGNQIPEGQRNNTLASLAGNMRRVGMGESEILAAIQMTNQLRCSPPLPESEVVAIAKSVCRYEPDTVAVAVAENHYDQMFKPEPAIIEPGPIPEELLRVPGFINNVIDYNLRNAIRPQPVLALAAAIQLQAVLAARKVCDGRENRTNLYVIGVAGSGAGKEFARKINRRILNAAGLNHFDGHDELASDAGLIKAVEKNPAILFQIDEFGRYLRTMGDPKRAPHLYNVITAFMKLFSCADSTYKGKAYADPKRNVEIHYPCVGLYATTVPENLYQGITLESLKDGFYARLLLFDTDLIPKRQPKSAEKVPQEIIETAKWWEMFNPTGNLHDQFPEPVEVPTLCGGQDVFDDLAARVDEELAKQNLYSSVWARTEEKACRLALIYACSANPQCPVIDEAAAHWACRLSEHITRKMIYIADQWVSDGYFDEKQKKLLRIIKDMGGRITQSELCQRTRSLQRKERTEIIDNLLETGAIKKEQVNTTTKYTTCYVLME
ncbi:MAG TPA: bifunctional DNA primase/polymerase [Anaerohalosphaeraceae bacterium]|nr:bifunctional DNA primase/polymerase [Anaerohalosphaeraceae bacterium]HRS72333.1 bifunctional DNA primase/polymerase [Anaerohalosphaeraceae bacterium]